MTDGFLSKAYSTREADGVRRLYDDWAATYEAEISENGYATPGRCAAALAQYVTDKAAPVLDFGCGTGLSGLALKLAGFETIDGVDVSPDMLDRAREKNIYRTLTAIDADDDLPAAPGQYNAIAAIGVIGASAAPASSIDDLMHALDPGGFFVLSLNDHALADRIYEAKLCEWIDCGAAHLLFRENGPHLPGINMNANVYVIEKA
ncbi:methyltransferase type 11 [Sulfitobacter sp. JL08]|uniref:class I SAM-dependent DNA methyltransferase n=1 Tax=Sulfitobacter sp. JL08 TaxID=2070369 RepID=UPI000E0B5EE3|nr:methyltransferase domain-containing protein [Sulfitobacter sp. JL08]AXI54706.1 methyltransferase type 11 [Sulfitobacter sp. JL08]